MNYKDLGNGEYCRINDDGTKGQSFNEKNSPGRIKEMNQPGNTIEEQFTTEELAQKEIDGLSNAKDSFNSLVKTRLLEADKWELPSVLILIDKTIEEVINYKQLLRDMSKTHTTLEQYLNPELPAKLTNKGFS